MKKKILALTLSIILLLTLFIPTVLAEGNNIDDNQNNIEIEDETGSVQVNGDLPDGASVEITTPDSETMDVMAENIFSDQGEYFSTVEFHDISIIDEDGEKHQPDSPVTVTLKTTVPTDVDIKVIHILDDNEAIKNAKKDGTLKSYIDGDKIVYYTEINDVTVNDDGTISFETDSFSIFAVNGYNDQTVGEQITPNETITMKRGEVRYFKWEPPADVLTSGRGTWTVESGDQYVDFEVYNSNLSDESFEGDIDQLRYQYYWLKLTAKEVSGDNKATIQFEYVLKFENETVDSTGEPVITNTYERTQEYFYVSVKETENIIFIDDQVADNGCLVPGFTSDINTDGLEYVWTRSDGKTVSSIALEEPYAVSPGAVNVALDRGGVDSEDVGSASAMKTYTLTVKRDGDEIGTADYTVNYGNELLNGSFEYPQAAYPTHDFPNGTKDLFWKTTGESIKENEVCQDIEFLTYNYEEDPEKLDRVLIDTYGLTKLKDGVVYDGTKLGIKDVEIDKNFPDGDQTAEINCDAPGALYQDILTYPDAEMFWSFNHRGRNLFGVGGGYAGAWNPDGHTYTINGQTFMDQKDYMYVIAAPTAQVKDIKTQEQLDELIKAANFPERDYSQSSNYVFDSEGKEVNYKGINFKIWELATDHTAWKKYGNTVPYLVEDGEYLTRFFFAAGSTVNDRILVASGKDPTYSVGNFIDDVSFSDQMPWSIEYYKDGELQTALTESGHVKLDRDDMSYELNKTAKYDNTNTSLLQQTTLVKTEINGRSYVGNVLDVIYTNHNVLQLYFETFGVTVTKKVEVANYDELSEDDVTSLKKMLETYKVEFGLFEKDAETPVATAELTVDNETFIGTATFVDEKNEMFIPEKAKTYIIKETNSTQIDDLVLVEKAKDSEELTGSLVYAYTATNVYNMNVYGDLTITKKGADLEKDKNQTFLFRITGPESFSMDVTIVGNDSVTINHIPCGTYTVEELTDWSWRYELVETVPENGNVTLTSKDNQQTVTFTNKRNIPFWESGDFFVRNWWGSEKTAEPIE